MNIKTKEVNNTREESYLKAMVWVLRMVDENDKVKRILMSKQAEEYLREMI